MKVADLFRQYRERINPPYGRKDFFAITATLFLMLAIPLTVILATQVREERGRAQVTASPVAEWLSSGELVKSGKKAAPGEILEVNFTYNEAATQTLKLGQVYKKEGYAPKYQVRKKDYTLQVFDQNNKLIYSQIFSVPSEIKDPPPLPGQKAMGLNKLKKVDFALTVPLVESAKELKVLDPTER